MKKLTFLFVVIVSIQSSYALTTVIDGTTYTCEPDYPSPPIHKSYYCTIDSAFDGTFGGSGRTELEARNIAKQACKVGSRSNGFHCEERTIQCESSN